MNPTPLDEDSHPQLNASGSGYAWEADYKRSWDLLLSADGISENSLQGIVSNLQQQALLQKRRRLNRNTAPVQRGIIRHLIVILDQSKAMTDLDLRPTRIDATISVLDAFIHEFFDQNPLSHVGVVGMRDGVATKLVELSSNPADIVRSLSTRNAHTVSGEPSLQNALGLAHKSLSHVPKHVSREIIIIYGSLTSCDPGNLLETVQDVANDRIRISVIGLTAEMHVCKKMCTETHGKYGIALSESHLRELLFEHIAPPLLSLSQHESNIIQMGFPISKTFENIVMCSCHAYPVKKGYICPRCFATICEIPADCSVCSLTLVSSPSLSRSYHHLFPVSTFIETGDMQRTNIQETCFACLVSFKRKSDDGVNVQLVAKFGCPKCKTLFCLECDVYIHETLHNCPGCLSRSSQSIRVSF